MTVIRFILKLALLPLLLAATLIEWVGVFLTSFGGVILYLLSGVVFLIAVAGRIVLNATWAEIVKLLGLSFGIFMVSVIADLIVAGVGGLATRLRQFIRS